jgi:putative FmdB family regulatory protein
MPIYEYRCGDCGRVFELLRPVGADATGVSCPECSSAKVERVLSCFASTPSSGPKGGSAGSPAPT